MNQEQNTDTGWVEPIENINLEEINEEKVEYKIPAAHQTLLPLVD